MLRDVIPEGMSQQVRPNVSRYACPLGHDADRAPDGLSGTWLLRLLLPAGIGGNPHRPLHAKLADHAQGAVDVDQQPLVQAVLAVYYLLDERLPKQGFIERLTPREPSS